MRDLITKEKDCKKSIRLLYEIQKYIYYAIFKANIFMFCTALFYCQFSLFMTEYYF